MLDERDRNNDWRSNALVGDGTALAVSDSTVAVSVGEDINNSVVASKLVQTSQESTFS